MSIKELIKTVDNPSFKRVKCEIDQGSIPKKLSMYINSEFKDIDQKYKIYSRQITCLHDPNETTLEDAWKTVHKDLKTIIDHLEENENTFFITACIEIHTGSKNINKKKETKKPEKEKTAKEKEEEKKKIEKEQEKEKKNLVLKGYPHIHIWVSFTSKQGEIVNNNDIFKYIIENTTFESDVEVKGGDKKKETVIDRLNTFRYSIKNSRHEAVYEGIKKAISNRKATSVVFKDKRFKTYLNVFGFNTKKDKTIDSFFKGMRDRNCAIHFISEDIKENAVNTDLTVKVNNNGKQTEQSKFADHFDRYSKTLIRYMIENNLAMCHDEIYQKIVGSDSTYYPFMSVNELLSRIYKEFKREDYFDMLGVESKVRTLITTKETEYAYPQISISKFWIEFKDCYYHIPSATIVKKTKNFPKNIYCGFYSDEIDFDFIKNAITSDPSQIIPSYWLAPLKKQKFMKDKEQKEKYLCGYYMLQLPLMSKAGVLIQLGPPNTGKSASLKPIRTLIGEENIFTLNKSDRFGMSMASEYGVCIEDDGDQENMTANNMLQLCEGGGRDLTTESKTKDAKKLYFKGNIAFNRNKLPLDFYLKKYRTKQEEDNAEYEYNVDHIDPALKVRFNIVTFDYVYSSDEIREMRKGESQRLTNFELGKLVLFTGTFYAKLQLDRKDKNNNGTLVFSDDYDECKEMINEYESLYKFNIRNIKPEKERIAIEECELEAKMRKQLAEDFFNNSA